MTDPNDETPPAAKRRKIDESAEYIKQLEARIKTLEAAKTEAEAKLNKNSLRRLLELSEESTEHFNINMVGSHSSHIDPRHLPSNATIKEMKLSYIPKNDVPIGDVSNYAVRLNRIQGKSDSKLSAPNCHSEADVALLVNELLGDCLEILRAVGIPVGNVTVYQERSLFGQRYDVTVVRNSEGQVVLHITEVKKPLPKGGLANEPKVLGQALDYALDQEASGQHMPFVVVTSIKETFVCWDSKNKEATKSFEEGVTIPQNNASTPKRQKDPAEAFSESPPPLKEPPEHEPSSLEPVFVPVGNRNMYRSKIFGGNDLVHVLCTTLCHAIQARHEKQPIHDLKQGKFYKFPKVLRFTVDTYQWGSLVARIGDPVNKSRSHATNNTSLDRKCKSVAETPSVAYEYYCIGRLGRGATSNVWHALDANGNQVAIKVFVRSIAQGRSLNSDDFDKVAEEQITTEILNLKSLYPFLRDKVMHRKLCGAFHCIVMPLLVPIEKADREKALPEIQKVLEGPFSEQKKKYSEDDIRWRHVGVYHGEGKKEHVLYDLAVLDKLGPDEENYVERHLTTLKDRIREAPAESVGYRGDEVPGTQARLELVSEKEK